MATKKNLGRVAFVYRCDFDPNTFYSRYDVVKYHGSLYHCTYNKSAYRKYNAPINEDGEYNSDWELFLPGCDFVGQNIISSDETIIVKETDKGYDLSTKHTVVKAADGSKNVTIKFDKAINTYTVSVVDNKITTAQWKNWWIKYPWDVNLAPQTITYSGPMHFSSNSLNIIGMKYGDRFVPCISDDGSMSCVVDGKTIPVVKWDVQYNLDVDNVSPYTTLLEGLQFQSYYENNDGELVANTPQNVYYVPDGGVRTTVSAGCFIVTGPNGYTIKWKGSGGGGTWNKDYAYTGTLKDVDNIGLIFCIINRPEGREEWHLHNSIGISNTLTWDHSTGAINNDIYSDANQSTLLGANEKMTGPDNWYAFKLTPSWQDKPLSSTDNNYQIMDHWFIYKLSEEEKKKYLSTDKTGAITSTVEVDVDDVQFNITVLGKEHSCEVKKRDCINYNIIFDDNAKSYTATISYSNLPNELVYTFEENCILDIDKNNPSKSKRIYKKGDKISIPYYSGCTFIKNE